MAADATFIPVFIRGARVIDPARGMDQVADILVLDGKIASVTPHSAEASPEGVQVIEAAGMVACPGFIDIHCHLREPGLEYKETIYSGSRSRAGSQLYARCPTRNRLLTTPPWWSWYVNGLLPTPYPEYSPLVALPRGAGVKNCPRWASWQTLA